MRAIKFPVAVFIILGLSACKVEIEVPTSGSVTTTSGAISCAAGTTCTIDVNDIYFDETFEAQPAQDFVFSGWKKRDGGLCGGSTNSCGLNTSGFEGNGTLTAVLEDPEQLFYLQPTFQSTGFTSLFIGHSFFKPFAEGLPAHATDAGILNHSQSIVFSGGATGAPEAMWDNVEKRAATQAILDGGDIELFVMTYHSDYPGPTGYRKWIDYALAQNPDTRFAVALPWDKNPAEMDTATYESNWHSFHPTTFHNGVDYLRSLYPGTDIFCIPYGQSAVELRKLFDADSLDDVSAITGDVDDAIYRDTLGHPGTILIALGRLVWLNAIYGVDLGSYDHETGYDADLKAIAQGIMDDHDPAYDASYR